MTQTFMMILNWTKPFGLQGLLYTKIPQHRKGPGVLTLSETNDLCIFYRNSNQTCVAESSPFPVNTGRSSKADSMLGHRRRRWPNIESTLGEHLVFAGRSRMNI